MIPGILHIRRKKQQIREKRKETALQIPYKFLLVQDDQLG
jgi:hypothetical protein